MDNILFVSDIHLGDPRFIYAEELDHLLTTRPWRTIYLVGDIIDVWCSPLAKILAENKDIINLIDQMSRSILFKIIRGNHDPRLKTLQTLFPSADVIPNEYQTWMGGRKTYIAHGHTVDPINFVLRPLYEFHRWIGKTFGEASIITKAASRIKKLFYDAKLKPWARADQRAINRWNHDTKVIITGHSHGAKLLRTPHITYLNLGAFIAPDPTYATYDASSNRFELRHLLDHGRTSWS